MAKHEQKGMWSRPVIGSGAVRSDGALGGRGLGQHRDGQGHAPGRILEQLTVEARRVPEIDDPGGAVAGPMSPGDQRLEHGFAGLYAPRRPLL